MRHAVFTSDGLDIVCDTSADAASHARDLRDICLDVRRFEADDERIFDIGHDALRDGQSWATARRLMLEAVALAAAAPAPVATLALPDDERAIVSALLSDADRLALLVSVFDGEEWSVKPTRDPASVRSAVGATCETTLRFRDPATLDKSGSAAVVGSVVLIHGNGCDVIHDYSDGPAMSSLIAGALAAADRLAVAS